MIYKGSFQAAKESAGLREAAFFAAGKRSEVYRAEYNGKPAAVKVEKKGIDAKGRIANEVRWLKRLNKEGIGPKLFGYGDDFFVCAFVEGRRIGEWLASAQERETKKVLLEILAQCRKMDIMNVTKEEMHNPYKHIIIGKKPVMIDFERCRSTPFPKNVSQFCQYLASRNILPLLEAKGIRICKDKLIRALVAYKQDYSGKSYEAVLKAAAL